MARLIDRTDTTVHPLEPLSETEIRIAAEVVRSAAHLGGHGENCEHE